MEYPKRILPRSDYSCIDSNSVVKNNIYLVRHTITKDISERGSNMVAAKYVCEPRVNMNNLSFNALGIFKEEYCYISIHKGLEYTEEWSPGNKGLCPKTSHFDILKDRGWFYVPFDKIHDKSVPKSDSIESDFRVTSCLIHKPTIETLP